MIKSTSHVLNGRNCLLAVMRGCIIFGQEIMTDSIKCNSGNGCGDGLRARNDKMVRSYVAD